MEGLARSRIGKQHQQRAPTAGDLKDIVKESLRWKMPTPAVNATIASANSKSTSSSQQTIQHQQSSSSVSSPSFPLHKLSASKTPTSSPITTTNENTPDTDSTTTTTTPSIAAREIWYNDPVLLAEQIEIQIARASSSVKLDSVLQVLYRHLGAGTPEVYGRVINALFEKGEQSRAWSAYRKMLSFNKKPTPQTITLLMNSFANKVRSQKNNHHLRTKTLMEAAEFWAQIRDEREHISIEQINAFLNVCRICVAEGGWDIAWSNYQDSEAKFDKLPTPDIITYTIMLKMCAENGSSDGYSAAMRLWKTLIGRCSHETPHHAGKSQKASGSTPKSLSQSSLPIATFNPLLKGGLSIDEQVIAPLLLLAIRTPNMEEARAILPIVSQWFKLPIPLTNRHDLEQKRRGGPSLMERELRYSHTNSEANTSQKSPLVWAATPENISLSYPLEISTQTLDLLLRLANRVKEFQIGKEWFDILVNKRQVYTDSVAQTSLVTLLTQGGMYTDALNQASLLPRERSERERLKRLMTVDEATCRIAASARSAADAATTRATKSLPLFTKAVTGILKREGRWTCPEWKATTTDLTMLRNILFVLHQTNNNHQYTAPHNDLVRTVLQSTIPSILEYLKRVVGDRTRKMELYEEGRGGGGGEKKDKKGSTLVDHTPRRLLFEKGERRALMEYISMVQDGKWDKIRVKAEYKNSGVLLVLFELLVLSSQAINSTGVKQQQHIHHQQLKQQQQQQQYHQLLHGINKALAAFPDYLKSVSADEDTTDDGVKVIRKKIRK